MESSLFILILNFTYLGISFAGTDSIAEAVFPSKEEMWREIQRQRNLINQETDLRMNYEQNFLIHINTLANLEKRINDDLTPENNDNESQKARLSAIENELATAAKELEEMTNRTNVLTSARHDSMKHEKNQEARLSALERRLEEMENRTNILTSVEQDKVTVKYEDNQEEQLSALKSELVTALRRLEEMENRTNRLTPAKHENVTVKHEENQEARLSALESELVIAVRRLDEMENRTNTLTSTKQDTAKHEENLEARLLVIESELVTAEGVLEEMKNTTKILTAGLTLLFPRNCLEIKRHYSNATYGVYTIYPDSQTGVNAYCDMGTDGGGWTVLLARSHNRFQGNRSWAEYKAGFGNVHGSYWIGNENIHLLTANQPCQIYFKLQSVNDTWYYAKYENFRLGSEKGGYTFYYDMMSYTGTAGESLWRSSGKLYGRDFSTYDRDNDRNKRYNCAVIHGGGGGWWYDDCQYALLTAMPEGSSYFRWYYNVGRLKAAYMMIRPM